MPLLFLAAIFAFPNKVSAGTLKHYTSKDGILSDTITSIIKDKDGNIWAGTVNGISKYDGEKWEKFTVENGYIKDNSIWAIGVVPDKASSKIWFGTGFGIAILDKNHWTQYIGPYENPKTKQREEGNCPIESNVINKMLVSIHRKTFKNSVFLIAGGKLYKFSDDKWSTYDFPDELLKNSNITCLHSAGDDSIWLGTSGQGAIEFNMSNMKMTTYTKKEGLPSDYVTAIHCGRDGKIWIGTENGLGILENNSCTVLNYKNSKLVSDYITAIETVFFGNIAIATDKGLNLHDGKVFKELPESLLELNGKVVWSMYYNETADKNFSEFVIGTRGFGIYTYEVPKDAAVNQLEDNKKIALQRYGGKNYIGSLAKWQEILKTDPENKDALLYSAKCYLNLGKKDDSKNLLIKMAEKYPDHKEAVITLGEIYEKEQNFMEALSLYQKLAERFPNEADGYIVCGNILCDLKKFDKAIDNYNKARAINADLPSIYKGLSKCYFLKGEFSKAIEIANQLQYKKPDDNENNVQIAKIYIAMQKYDKSEEELKKVLMNDEHNGPAKSALGQVYLEKGKFKDAEKLLQEAISANFKDHMAHIVLSLVYIESNNIVGAKEEVNYALSLSKNEFLLSYAQGRIAEIEGRQNEAVDYYKNTITSGYSTAGIHYRLANTLKALERYDEALKEYRKVLELDPNFSKAEDVKWMISKLSIPTDDELSMPANVTVDTSSASTGNSGTAANGTETKPGTGENKPSLDELDF